ncbi:MAG TPA: serine hydrolase domain-containing protein [Acidimicrobiales bacterium]|nr:serine hydrolase domain-containing protein [Acidimicrobiales bacterium]
MAAPPSLPRSTPAAEGVDSRGVLALLDALEAGGFDPHSLMVLRHGRVVAEGWWAPYGPATTTLLYSLSKTFTAAAVGLAVGEGRLGVDDLVADLLAGSAVASVPEPRPAHLDRLRVRHLLAMASGHHADTMLAVAASPDDPVGAFLRLEPDHEPGTWFAYNQGCTLTLSAIVTARTGERLVDYLRPRLFEPLGIPAADWLRTRVGVDQGFSGLHVATESIAKLGQLLLDGGRWAGRQLLPAGFVADARRRQVANEHHSQNADWRQGYGWQMWMCTHGAVRGDGAFGQFCVLLPDADAVVVLTSQTQDMQGELDALWAHLLPALGGPVDPGADAELAGRLAALSTATRPAAPAAAGGPGRAVEAVPAGRLDAFRAAITGARVEGTRLTLRTARGEHRFDLPVDGSWAWGALPGLHTPFAEVAVTGGWTGPGAFDADVVFVRTPHRLRLAVRTDPVPVLRSRWQEPPLGPPVEG